MNNLLQSLSSHRLRLRVPDSDLKRLFGAVKESRGHDSKLSDAFHESLEGVMQDLRTVTIDNHDAEAFLKPVNKVDYPDYSEIIKEPMDLQTMLKKVKQKQYKSKKEFQDDLELIWTNCYTYNTGENHPLRLCAKRLQEKANRLLKNITDRRDRLDPPLPPELRSPIINGITINGHSRKHSATSVPKSTPTPTAAVSTRRALPDTPPPSIPRREATFADSPAFVRSATGMSTFAELDRAIDSQSVAGPSKLRRIIDGDSVEEDIEWIEPINGVVGEKRKLGMNGVNGINGDSRPWKRQRVRSRSDAEPVELWWDAATTSSLMANGLPELRFRSFAAAEGIESSIPPPTHIEPMRKRRRKRPPEKQVPRSLLSHINNNIRTIRRVRRTHDKFLALNLSADDGTGQGTLEPPEPVMDERDIEVNVVLDERPWRSRGTGVEIGEQDADDCLHWMGTKVLEHAGFQSTSKAALDVFTGVATEYFLNVGRTLRFLCDKYSQRMSAEEIILHALFESGITHVRDLERYINDDVLRYGNRLTELERKLLNAYNEVVAETALDDDAFFAEDEDEEGELLMGNFADTFGEDFLGLRELGIASEFGLSSLTIPKRLLRGRHKQRGGQDGAKPKEPPLPYPPPPPFIPLDSSQVPTQIGLLRTFYMQRLNDHSARTAPAQPPPFVKPQPRALSPATKLEFEIEGRDLGAYMAEMARTMESVPNPVYVGGLGLGDGGDGSGGSGTIGVGIGAGGYGGMEEGAQQHLLPPVVLPDDAPQHARTRVGPLGQVLRPAGGSAPSKKKKDPAQSQPSRQGSGPGPGQSQSNGTPGPGPGLANGNGSGPRQTPLPSTGSLLGVGPMLNGSGVLTLASPAQMAASASASGGGGGGHDGSPKKSSSSGNANGSPKKKTETPMQQFITSLA